jgi:hypothetical protein
MRALPPARRIDPESAHHGQVAGGSVSGDRPLASFAVSPAHRRPIRRTHCGAPMEEKTRVSI